MLAFRVLTVKKVSAGGAHSSLYLYFLATSAILLKNLERFKHE
jgi:hypothetical protein